MNKRSLYSIDTICRICLNLLQSDEVYYDVFIVPGLAKKLCVCTSLSVEPEDGFPSSLCTQCFGRLNDMHDFQKMCIDSVRKFHDMVANNLIASVGNHDINEIDNVDVFAPPEVQLEEDRSNFDPLLNTKVEIIENEEEVFKMIENVDKETDYVDKESAIESEDEENDEDGDSEANSSESEDIVPLSCLKVGARSSKTTPKTDCKKRSTRSKPKRGRNLGSEADGSRFIECHICQQKFKSEARYEEHMKHHNDLLPFQCTVETCKKGFTSSGGLRVHMDHSHPELCQMIPCTFEGCNKTFPKTVLLTFHMKKEHNVAKPVIKRHPCKECDKVFVCPSALKKHMYKHTGEELPFACEICGKRYPNHSVLRDHLLRHAGIKNHICSYCGVGKTTRQELGFHMLTHTREKQYQCPQCDHTSHNKQALTNHIKVVHLKIKNHACQYCGKTFGKSYACKLHERTHTGENCSECKICGRKFVHEKSLTRHLQNHEKGDVRPSRKVGKKKGDKDEETDSTLLSVRSMEDKHQPPKPSKSNRVEVVDISQLAGLTEVNPIPIVSVPAWSQGPLTEFPKKDGQHICPGCGKGFNIKASMKMHYKLVHLKVKDFACRYCPQRFGKAQYLRHHEYIHTGEKPYECKICGQHFRHSRTLANHMRVHNKEPKPPKEKPPHKPRVDVKSLKRKADEATNKKVQDELKVEYSKCNKEDKEVDPKIQEAACEQLDRLHKEIHRKRDSYESYYMQKTEAEAKSSSN